MLTHVNCFSFSHTWPRQPFSPWPGQGVSPVLVLSCTTTGSVCFHITGFEAPEAGHGELGWSARVGSADFTRTLLNPQCSVGQQNRKGEGHVRVRTHFTVLADDAIPPWPPSSPLLKHPQMPGVLSAAWQITPSISAKLQAFPVSQPLWPRV